MLFVIVTVVLVACDDDENEGTGILKVHLTDAPVEYDAVLVDLQGLEINASNDSTEEGGWQVLMLDTMGQIDLLMFTDGNSIQLTEEELPVGRINQMRMILGENNEVVVDGVTHDLETPSADQSGLKFNINADIVEGETFSMLIDFDAEKSVIEKGNGKYSLKPVITVITEF